jgi:hypothetical protein
MKKTCLLCVVLCFSTLLANAQTTYDVFTYTEPNDYKKETKTGVVTYTKTDSKTGTYCMISLYPQTPSSGDIKKDFENDWQDLVVKPLEVKDAPKADNSDDITGWKTYSGAANFEFAGGTSMALLTTAKKENVNSSILVVTNAQSYLPEIDAFLDKLKLGKPKAAVVKTAIAEVKDKGIVGTNDIPTLLAGKYQNGTGALSDYKFIIPPSFSGTIYSNEIQFTVTKTYSNAIVSLLPLTAYTGNIETDLNTIFFQQFKDWLPHTTSGFKAGDGVFEKGTTCQGFPYIRAKKMLTKSNEDYSAQKTDGLVLLIKVGNKLATIVAAQPFQSISDEANEALNYLLFTLRFNNTMLPNNLLQNDMIGSWSSAGGGVGLSNTYYKNGTFDFGGAAQFRVSHDANYDKVTTTSYGSSGTYHLRGNELTQTFKSNKNTTKELLRIYYTQYNAEGWKYKMQTLDPNWKCNEPCVPKGVEYNNRSNN